MRTPSEYMQNIDNKIITDDMLAECLYSVNKRAKNWRDVAREYRGQRYHNEKLQNAEDQRDKYYSAKDFFLQFLKPVCIHEETYGYEKRRIFDDDPDYDEYADDFVWTNRYYDRDIDEFVYFGDIILWDCPKYHYYLFYKLGEYSYHQPISENDLTEYLDLEIKELDHPLITHGQDTRELVSTQFIKKTILLLASNDYKFEFAKPELIANPLPHINKIPYFLKTD